MSENQKTIAGTCDSGCGRAPTQFYKDTSVATCGNAACIEIQDERWEAHCKEMDSAKD